MALLQGNTYIKISGISIDYLHSVAYVSLRCYNSKEDRDKEKKILAETRAFLFRASQSIASLQNQLLERQIEVGLTVENSAKIFSSNPKLKELTDKVYALQKEYDSISQCIGRHKVNRALLKFPDFWGSLGLTEEICSVIIPLQEETISVPIPEKADIADVYLAIKDFFPSSVDC